MKRKESNHKTALILCNSCRQRFHGLAMCTQYWSSIDRIKLYFSPAWRSPKFGGLVLGLLKDAFTTN